MNDHNTLGQTLTTLSTGATGYIGGDILHEVLATFETVSVAALVRDAERAKAIKERYPQVTPVEGDLDCHQLIEDQVSQADIVISCNLSLYS